MGSSSDSQKALSVQEDREKTISDWVSPELWTKSQEQFRIGDLVEFYREGKLFQHWGLYLGEGLVVHVSSFDLWNPSAALTERLSGISQASSRATVDAMTGISTLPGAKADEMVELVQLPVGGPDASNPANNAPVQENAHPVPCVQCGEITIEHSPLDLGFGMEDRTKWFIKVEDICRIAGRDKFRVNNVATRKPNRLARTPQEIFTLVRHFKDQEVDYSLVSSNCEHFATSLKYKQDGKTNEEPEVVPVVVHAGGTSSQVRRVVQLISIGMVAVAGLLGAAVGSLMFGGRTAAASDVVDSSGPVTKKVKAEEKRNTTEGAS
ncbi:uncharacterized protein LOC129585833 [Paramacrobiotus metropolitanus]|uniref:uncharacterized protein LOC129585833 n=1 Tax=Paramacrobiotus metropolitanus TaxID=2943436 RepID=UPI00244656CD|nr:uncharacterized protein LOC129585833 [Paramacrobiotus metropolitanus]